jgi:hypothetical protein
MPPPHGRSGWSVTVDVDQARPRWDAVVHFLSLRVEGAVHSVQCIIGKDLSHFGINPEVPPDAASSQAADIAARSEASMPRRRRHSGRVINEVAVVTDHNPIHEM